MKLPVVGPAMRRPVPAVVPKETESRIVHVKTRLWVPSLDDTVNCGILYEQRYVAIGLIP